MLPSIPQNALFEAVEKAEMFGEVVAKVAVIESQKRGLLHCHIVYTLKKQIETPEEVDEIVQAYFPDAKTVRKFRLVLTWLTSQVIFCSSHIYMRSSRSTWCMGRVARTTPTRRA